VRQGASANKVYLINRGLVKLTRLEEGGQEVVVGLRTPGWLLGAASVVLQEPYPVSATTLTRCELRLIPAEEFRHWLKTNEPLSWYLHWVHSREVYDLVAHVSGLACLSTRQRLEQLLRQLKHADVLVKGKEERLQLPISQSELARLIAVTPQYLSRLLKELEAEELIERAQGGRRILLSKKLG
jgi:CRP/FNR family transcriptional regulator